MLRVADLGKITCKANPPLTPHSDNCRLYLDAPLRKTFQKPLSKAYLDDSQLRGASAKFRPANKRSLNGPDQPKLPLATPGARRIIP